MKTKLAANVIAGWLLLVPAIQVAVIWYILFFVAMPKNLTVWDSIIFQLQVTFSEDNPMAWWFVWLVALPLLCIVLSIAYLRGAARTRVGGILLFATTIALAITTFVHGIWNIAFFVALPSVWGYRAIHAT